MGVDPSDLLNQGLYEEPESDLIIPTLMKREEREEARGWWTKLMEHLFLEILVEEAQRENKPSNTFKVVSINRVAEAISERFQVQCERSIGFGWDDNMKMITYDRATYDAAVMAHKKYEPFLNKSIDHYDEMALVVGKDMATGSFARTFADIDLDDGNQDSVSVDCDNEEAEEQFTADKTPHLYEEVMSMEEEGFDDDFLCSVFDYLVSHESEAKSVSLAFYSYPKADTEVDTRGLSEGEQMFQQKLEKVRPGGVESAQFTIGGASASQDHPKLDSDMISDIILSMVKAAMSAEKKVCEWVRIPSYDPKPRCSPCEPFANPRHSSPACQPYAAPLSDAVSVEFFADTRTTASPRPIRAFPLSCTLSTAPLCPTSLNFPTLPVGCKI
ncbi:hypothetical protein Gotur_014043 [Gossypium turneri]